MKLLWSTLLASVVALVLTGAAAASTTTTYSIADLGSLGYGVTHGLAINNNGQITGYSYTSQQIQVSCPPRQYGQPKKCYIHPYHAFLWSGGKMTDLGTLGGNNSRGNAINLSGQVVGTADLKTGFSDGFLWNGSKMVDIGAFNPGGINDSGVVGGTCGPNPGEHACIWSNGNVTELANPTNFTPFDCGGGPINDNGEMIAGCDDSNSYLHALLYQSDGTVADLGTLGGPQASASGINGFGQVVGWAQTSTDASDGFLWSGGKMTDLGPNFSPAAINDNGVMVGGDEVDSGGLVENLNSLIPAGSRYQIQYANAINDNGQIVADAYDTATFQTHALLLTPNG